MAPTSPSPPPEPDRLCITCGYSLAGLEPDGVCPECGTPIQRSIRGGLLRDADTRYVRTLVRGAWWLRLGAMLTLAMLGVTILFFILAFTGLESPIAAVLLLNLGLLLAIPCVWWFGTHLLTRPEPGGSEPERVPTMRAWARAGIIGGGAVFVLVLVGGLAASTRLPELPLHEWLKIACMPFVAAHFFGLCRYIRWLARRIPSPALVRDAPRSAALAGAVAGVYFGSIGMGLIGWAGLSAVASLASFAGGLILVGTATDLAITLHGALAREHRYMTQGARLEPENIYPIPGGR